MKTMYLSQVKGFIIADNDFENCKEYIDYNINQVTRQDFLDMVCDAELDAFKNHGMNQPYMIGVLYEDK